MKSAVETTANVHLGRICCERSLTIGSEYALTTAGLSSPKPFASGQFFRLSLKK